MTHPKQKNKKQNKEGLHWITYTDLQCFRVWQLRVYDAPPLLFMRAELLISLELFG